ncbi:MAG: ferrochelatase [candidate division Zixibacteria bacterium]|nr:ferrochelatase [candidate division Zixibacteria bacterium]
MADYQAILVVSFGGPEGPEDIMPFLHNVLRGRNVPPERMEEVAKHYRRFGGVSPINGQNRRLIAALETELKTQGMDLPVYWGNRNWHPMLPDTVETMKRDGVRRALAFVTSAYSSYSNCRQYLENIEEARRAVGEGAPVIDKLRAFFHHPGFLAAQTDRVAAALNQIPSERRASCEWVFTAHSIPLAMAAGCRYETQLRETARLIAASVEHPEWTLVYQSRSGPSSQPWLEPDIGDYLQELYNRKGSRDVIVVPIGFVSDHIEVVYDIDVAARAVCDRLGHRMVRAETVGTHPRVVSMIRELIEERLYDMPERVCLGDLLPLPDRCVVGCCLSGRPEMRPA